MEENDEDYRNTVVEELTATEIVHENLSQLSPVCFDQREEDVVEERLIQEYAKDGCACSVGPDKSPCCQSITLDHYRSVRSQMAELSHDELDLAIMGQVMAGTFDDSTFLSKEKKKGYTFFFHHGVRICQKTFLFVHTIGYSRFKAVKASYSSRGVEPRVHKNKGKHRESGLSVEGVKGLVQFILNYAGK